MKHSIQPDIFLSCHEQSDRAIVRIESDYLKNTSDMAVFLGFSAARDISNQLYNLMATELVSSSISRSMIHRHFENEKFGEFRLLLLGNKIQQEGSSLLALFEKLIELRGGKSPVIVSLDKSLSVFPWELLPCSKPGYENSLLGDHIVFFTDLGIESEESYFAKRTSIEKRVSIVKRPYTKLVNGKVRVKAAGDLSIEHANEEQDLIERLDNHKFGKAEIAKPIETNNDRKAFFDLLNDPNYDIFHLFGHCNYEEISPQNTQFKVSVTKSHWLKYTDFLAHAANSNGNIVAFLNVCASMPAYAGHNIAPVDYFINVAAVPLAISTLLPIRSSEAVDFAHSFYDEIIPAFFEGQGISFGYAIWNSRQTFAKIGACHPLLYRPVGQIQNMTLLKNRM